MKKWMLILSCLFLSLGFSFAQSTQISGTVVDDTGEPVTGASVVVKGTNVGTITNVDGKFSINVPEGAKTLVFSLIGMQTIEETPKAGMRVVMEDDTELLDEVIVVAYGTAKKSAFTGSAGVLKSEDIVNRQTSNISNALAGQLAGVQVTNNNGQPGQPGTIRIRGINSINSSASPLYVIDGMPFDGQLSSINPMDIESMTVLKDAAANSMYGARGANGVILITTKKGSGKGRDAKISVDAKWGVNSRGVPNYDMIKSPAQYYELVYQGLYNGQRHKGATPDAAHAWANNNIFSDENGGVGYQVYTIPTGQDFIGTNGKINPAATLGYMNGDYWVTPDNWNDNVFKSDNLRQEYNIGISGATDLVNYYLSGGYLDDTGIIPNSKFKRYSTRTKLDFQVKKWLKIGTNLSYAKTISDYPASQTTDYSTSSANIFYVANMIAPIYPLYVRDAQKNKIKDNYGYTVYDFGNEDMGFVRTFMNNSNPIALTELDKRDYDKDAFSGKWYATADLYDGLKMTLDYGIDTDNTRIRRLYNAHYGQYAAVGGIAYVYSTRETNQTGRVLLSYNKSIDKHNFDVIAAYETYKYTYSYLMGKKEMLYNPNITEVDNGVNKADASSYTNNYAIDSYLSRIQYNYDGEFFGSASLRRDGSSRFAKENRWGSFWSFGGAWLLSKQILADVEGIDILKFKASYGEQGNDNLLYKGTLDPNYYPYLDQYKVSNFDNAPSLGEYYKGNHDITWEKTKSFNIGVDFELFKNKLYGSVEFFNKNTSDMLFHRPVPVINGFVYMPQNIGTIRNSGWEFDLNTNIIDTKNLKWNFNLNLTYYKAKIVSLKDIADAGYYVDGANGRIFEEGKALVALYIPKFAGVDKTDGMPMWYKNILDADNKVIGTETTKLYAEATNYSTGDLLAPVYGGFSTSINFKGFDASIAFAYQLGGKIYDSTYAQLMHNASANNAGANWHKDILNAWSENNTNSNTPILSSDGTPNVSSQSDRFLTSSDYLSLQNITVGYTLPRTLLSKINIESVRIYFVADNVALISARQGLDPRQSYTSAGSFVYSPIRTLSGGISFTF